MLNHFNFRRLSTYFRLFRLTEVYTSSIRVIEAVGQKYCKKKILSAEMISSYRGAILHGIFSS